MPKIEIEKAVIQDLESTQFPDLGWPADRREILEEINGRVPLEEKRTRAIEKLQEKVLPELREKVKLAEERKRAKGQENTRQRQFFQDQDERELGEPDCLGKMHKTFQGRFKETEKQKFYDAQERHDNSRSGRRKPGWGTWGNKTREEVGEEATQLVMTLGGAQTDSEFSMPPEYWNSIKNDPREGK